MRFIESTCRITVLPLLVVMPKAPRKKYYAVRVGRQGSKIYDTWEEVSPVYSCPLYGGYSMNQKCSANVRCSFKLVHIWFSNTIHRFRDGPELYLRASPAEQMHNNGFPHLIGWKVRVGVLSTSISFRLIYLSGGPSNPKGLPQSASAPLAHNHRSEISNERDSPISITEHVPGVHAPTVVLSEEQRTVLEMVQRGQNVFFTGSAGTCMSSFHPGLKLSFCRDRKVCPTPRHH